MTSSLDGASGWVAAQGLESLAEDGPLCVCDLEAAARELYAFVRESRRWSAPPEQHEAPGAAEQTLEYVVAHLGSATVPNRIEVDRQLQGLKDHLVRKGYLAEGDGTLIVTPEGRDDQARLYVRSHLTHVLKGMAEATALWALCRHDDVVLTGHKQISVVSEYAAFGYQRALLEIITKTGRQKDPEKEPTEATETRALLRIAEDDVPLADEVLGVGVVKELNRAAMHVGRRWRAPEPLSGEPLQERVAWLTGQVLTQWRGLRASGAVSKTLRVDWDQAAALAGAAAEKLLSQWGLDGSIGWDDEDDPFFARPFSWPPLQRRPH
jgi:hypothetical protein